MMKSKQLKCIINLFLVGAFTLSGMHLRASAVFAASPPALDGVTLGKTCYYKLEEVEVGSGRNWHGPVISGGDTPTSVTLSSLAVKNSGSPISIWWLVFLVTTVGASRVLLNRLHRSRL